MKLPKMLCSLAEKKCPGMCVGGRIADYCEAVLAIDEMCKEGLRCCVSPDVFGDNPPPELIVIDGNTTRKTITTSEYSATQMASVPLTTTSTTPAPTTSFATTTQRSKPLKPCNGECVSGWFALLCENFDRDADCADGGSCCIIDAPEKTVTYRQAK